MPESVSGRKEGWLAREYNMGKEGCGASSSGRQVMSLAAGTRPLYSLKPSRRPCPFVNPFLPFVLPPSLPANSLFQRHAQPLGVLRRHERSQDARRVLKVVLGLYQGHTQRPSVLGIGRVEEGAGGGEAGKRGTDDDDGGRR